MAVLIFKQIKKYYDQDKSKIRNMDHLDNHHVYVYTILKHILKQYGVRWYGKEAGFYKHAITLRVVHPTGD